MQRPIIKFLSVLMTTAIAACDSFDSSTLSASEIIKKNLHSPSSFSLVSGKKVWQGITTNGNPAYIVRIEYDAQNGFGANLRDCKLVAYYEDNDHIKWKPSTALNECDGNPLFDESHMIEYSRLANFDKNQKG